VLRLVEKADKVVSFDEAAALAEARSVLAAEAAELEAAYGKNAYSDFLVQHGCRPDPKQAAAIGRLTGSRVKASDGSMYPRRTKAERDATKTVRARRQEIERYSRQVSRLLQAISGLGENTDSPADILSHVHPVFDEPIILERLDFAVEWLSRFAQEWNRRGNRTDETLSESSQGDSP
jgi:hypothetical protein